MRPGCHGGRLSGEAWEVAVRRAYCPRVHLCCHRSGWNLLRFGGWSMGRKFDLWLFSLSIAWLVLVSSALVGMLLQWGGSEKAAALSQNLQKCPAGKGALVELPAPGSVAVYATIQPLTSSISRSGIPMIAPPVDATAR